MQSLLSELSAIVQDHSKLTRATPVNSVEGRESRHCVVIKCLESDISIVTLSTEEEKEEKKKRKKKKRRK